jgi:hypothetical protein
MIQKHPCPDLWVVVQSMVTAYFPAPVCPQCWENGIILCRKIAEQYESYYDYRNLSKMRVKYLGVCGSGVVPLCD